MTRKEKPYAKIRNEALELENCTTEIMEKINTLYSTWNSLQAIIDGRADGNNFGGLRSVLELFAGSYDEAEVKLRDMIKCEFIRLRDSASIILERLDDEMNDEFPDFTAQPEKDQPSEGGSEQQS